MCKTRLCRKEADGRTALPGGVASSGDLILNEVKSLFIIKLYLIIGGTM